MKVIVNGREAGTKESGCALCGATWGSYYEEVQGERLFFCCDLCAKGFREIVERAELERIDLLEISGNYSLGRHCTAREGDRVRRFYVKFNDDAEISTFKEE